MITLANSLAIDPHVRFRRFESDAVVIHQTAAEVMIFNDVAARLLEVIDGSRTLQGCVDLLADEFEAPVETIASDVLRFADELVAAGVAHLVSG